MELMTVFTSAPQVTILFGREEIGVVDPMVLVAKVDGPRRIALAGRSWRVTSVDWTRRRAYVEPTEGTGLATWMGFAAPQSFELTDAIRRVLLGADPAGVRLSRRAGVQLGELREEWVLRVAAERTVVLREDGTTRWWTWAGGRANAVLYAALRDVAPELLDETDTFDNQRITLRPDVGSGDLSRALKTALSRFGAELQVQHPASVRTDCRYPRS